MTQVLQLLTRDPLIARDGRPFGSLSSNRMRSLPWPLPSTVAGSIRTMMGNALGGQFNAQLIERLKRLTSHGPLPVSGQKLFLPAANHALIDAVNGKCYSLRPEEITVGGVDLPAGLWPALPPRRESESKFDEPPAWWSLEKMTQWLLTAGDAPVDFCNSNDQFREHPKVDERTHVKIDPDTFAAQKHMLFSSAGLVLDNLVTPDDATACHTELAVRADAGTDAEFARVLEACDRHQTIGGERRMVRIHVGDTEARTRFKCPRELKEQLDALQPGAGLRMLLATPAIFQHGWRPGWLKDQNGGLVGTPPGISPDLLKLRLVAVSNQRWEAVSGWSYESRGPKAVKWMVPAGGVYFFQIEDASGDIASPLWLQPVSDDPQDRCDGFGLAAWGLWNKR